MGIRHVSLLFTGLCVIIRDLVFERADERCLPAGDTVGARGESVAATVLHHVPSTDRKKASGNEAVVFPSQAILPPSIYISGSLAHQRGIYSPSVLLSCLRENVILLHYVYMSAGVGAAVGETRRRRSHDAVFAIFSIPPRSPGCFHGTATSRSGVIPPRESQRKI